jgi:hypothetical protein
LVHLIIHDTKGCGESRHDLFAKEAYQLAQDGINDFANLLPAAVPVTASAVDQTASQRTSLLFNIAPLGAKLPAGNPALD